MRKLITIVITMSVIVLVIVIGRSIAKINNMFSKQDQELVKFENQVSDLESQIKEGNFHPNSNQNSEEPIIVEEISKDKLAVARDNAIYETINFRMQDVISEIGLEIQIMQGKAYVTTNSTKAQYNNLFSNVRQVEKQEITGFRTDTVGVYYGVFGNDLNPPILFFLMRNGTVEYVNSLEMLNNQTYQSLGRIDELRNIKDFDYLSVHENDGGGYITTVAIDKEGYYYDLNELIKNSL